MGTNIEDEYLMMHIMNNLPSAHDSLIENLEDKLDSTFDTLTMSVLRDKDFEKYEKIKRRKGIKTDYSESEEEGEKELFPKTFKGRCRRCGKFGHKAADCKTDLKKGPWNPRSNKNNGGGNNQGRFQGKCNYCGKYGHKEADCWVKYGKPNAKEERNNQAAEEVEEQEEEVALLALNEEVVEEENNQDNEENNNDATNQDMEEDAEANEENSNNEGADEQPDN